MPLFKSQFKHCLKHRHDSTDGIFRIVTVLLTMVMLFPVQAAAFPAHHPVPGGISLLAIAPVTAKRPIVHYQGQRVTVVPYGNEWVAAVGIPLSASPGTHNITVTHPVTRQQFNAPFAVTDKYYRTQKLTIRDNNKVNPDHSSTQRIIRELAIQKDITTRFSERNVRMDFIHPVSGRDSGRFGLKRIINGEPRSPHSGMDIAAPSGTPIRSAANGTVLYTGSFFFSGNVVYVDHGSGVISLYAHLNSINVRPGDYARQGAIIGSVGQTGRTTGPHLHWSVYLNGQAIDPALFTQKNY